MGHFPGASGGERGGSDDAERSCDANAVRCWRGVPHCPPLCGPVYRDWGKGGIRAHPSERGSLLAILGRDLERGEKPVLGAISEGRKSCRLKRGVKPSIPRGSHRPAMRVGETVCLGSELGGWGHIGGEKVKKPLPFPRFCGYYGRGLSVFFRNSGMSSLMISQTSRRFTPS